MAAFTDAVATEMAPYGVTANSIMPGADTRLAQIGWRMGSDPGGRRDPVHVAEFACYLASPAAGWISGQTFQIRGGELERVSAWTVGERIERAEDGWTASELGAELPRLFGAGPKKADMPPAEWRARRGSRGDTRDSSLK